MRCTRGERRRRFVAVVRCAVLEDDVFEGAALGFGLAVVTGALEDVVESDD
jgi:hypothetical protein